MYFNGLKQKHHFLQGKKFKNSLDFKGTHLFDAWGFADCRQNNVFVAAADITKQLYQRALNSRVFYFFDKIYVFLQFVVYFACLSRNIT